MFDKTVLTILVLYLTSIMIDCNNDNDKAEKENHNKTERAIAFVRDSICGKISSDLEPKVKACEHMLDKTEKALKLVQKCAEKEKEKKNFVFCYFYIEKVKSCTDTEMEKESESIQEKDDNIGMEYMACLVNVTNANQQ